MPACIVELGFMNSPTDNQLFDANVENYAKAIGDAVLKTYEAYGKDGADATESVEDVPGTEEQISTETGEGTTGQVLQNTQIENVSSLDATSHDWGLGSHTDDENRPLDAVNAQETYGKYNAYFIGDDTKDIYLTFDEGYEYGQTESILNTLKEKRGVRHIFRDRAVCER